MANSADCLIQGTKTTGRTWFAVPHLGSSDDEVIWCAHLIDGCPRNPRRE